jgi:hypothetical protein
MATGGRHPRPLSPRRRRRRRPANTEEARRRRSARRSHQASVPTPLRHPPRDNKSPGVERALAQAIDNAIISVAQVVQLLTISFLRRLVQTMRTRRITFMAASLLVGAGVIRFLLPLGR